MDAKIKPEKINKRHPNRCRCTKLAEATKRDGSWKSKTDSRAEEARKVCVGTRNNRYMYANTESSGVA